MTPHILAATLLAALIAVPATQALAAATRSHGPTIERPGPDTGRTAEPGDPFFPARPDALVDRNSPVGDPGFPGKPEPIAEEPVETVEGNVAYAVDCIGLYYPDLYAGAIDIENVSGQTIPAGTVITIELLPSGQIITFVMTGQSLANGGFVVLDAFDPATTPFESCNAWVAV